MLRISCTIALLCAALGGGALVPRTSAQTGRLPKINYTQRTLPNGLTVFGIEDHSSPTVAVVVWYRVGSKDDPEGRSGFAHLFEHIMFKASKNMKSEMMDRLTEDVGGYNNAFTSDDMTVYHEVVPSNYLESIIWAEADRLASLQVDEANFKSERAVVQEEYRQSYAANPYGDFQLALIKKSFAAHPYKRPTIGSIEDLDAATVEDVIKFHSTYYRPDNATLVVSGDFDPKQFDAWVDKYFNRIPKPSGTVPRVTIKEPSRTAEQRFDVSAPNVPLPAVAFTYLAPPKKSDDAQALRVAEAILSAGESSRLYQALVYSQQVAQQAEASADLREDVSLFYFDAIAAGGKSLDDVAKALSVEIKKMQDAPVTAAELDKAKNQLVANKLRSTETNEGKALALAESAVLLGDPSRVNTDVEKLQAVTAADVQRVMKQYLTDTNRVVIRYTAAAAEGAKGGDQK